jgi:two-component system, sensor histidine kinase
MRMLEDILDSSLTHPGSFELLDAPFDPAALLREVATQFSDLAAQQGLFLRAEVAPGVPSQVMGDAPRLREVLGHLLGNAVKFTQSGGITARLAAETDSSGAPLLVLRVLDTGPGIPPEGRAALFQPRSSVEEAALRRPGGAGPGLVICGQLANAMRGEMTCEDAPGGGAEFRFAVPLRQPAPVPGAPPARLPPARVLVVDDVSLNRKVLSAILERDGHQVVVAATGEEAVASVAEGPPFDLVLMDLHMPGMDGIAATAAIRSLPGAVARVAVHALTADVSAHTSAEYEAAGFTGFLTKPLDRSAIRQAIAAAQVKAAASVGCAAAPPVLDGAHLARIFEGLPREVVGQMLNEFLRSLGEVLARLREQRNDGPALAQEVHSLKGLAGNFGAARLGEALASFQAQLDGGVAAGALPLGPLEAAYRDTVEAIRAGAHLRLFDAAGVGPPQPHREGHPT